MTGEHVRSNLHQLAEGIHRAGALISVAAEETVRTQLQQEEVRAVQAQTDQYNAATTSPGGTTLTFGDAEATLSSNPLDGVFAEQGPSQDVPTPPAPALPNENDADELAQRVAHQLAQAGAAYVLRGLQ